jgi:hypothetical protein
LRASQNLDVLWESLEIIDEGYLAEAAERKAQRARELRSAENVVRTVGTRGGFKYLSYEYVDTTGVRNHVSTAFRADADELIELLKSLGIPISEHKL